MWDLIHPRTYKAYRLAALLVVVTLVAVIVGITGQGLESVFTREPISLVEIIKRAADVLVGFSLCWALQKVGWLS